MFMNKENKKVNSILVIFLHTFFLDAGVYNLSKLIASHFYLFTKLGLS